MGTPVEQMPPPPATKTNVISIISLVVGIIGLLGVCVAIFIPVAGPICVGILAIVAIVTGFLGMNQVGKTGEKGRGMAIGGLILGVVTLLAACLLGVGAAVLGPQIGNILSQMSSGLINSGLFVPTP
ncbi:MAG: DUF4190 domain-containing protein [Anaerolineales bacterium]